MTNLWLQNSDGLRDLAFLVLAGLMFMGTQPLFGLTPLEEDEMAKVRGSEGLTIAPDVVISGDEFYWTDSDGYDGSGDQGRFGFGTASLDFASTSSDFAPIEIDPDGLNNHVPVEVVDGEISFESDQLYLGPSSNNAFSTFDLNEIDLSGSVIEIGAH